MDEKGSSGASKASKSSFVYFIGSIGGPIKIGCSGKPRERLASFRVGNERGLQLLATIPGGPALEASLHARFAPHRIRGEIFAATPELLALIWEAAAGRSVRVAEHDPASPLHRFLAERTARDLASRIRSSSLYDEYVRWCAALGEVRWTQKAFSMAMQCAGFRSKRSNGVQWLGLRLVATPAGQE